jgi:hypothetical protein
MTPALTIVMPALNEAPGIEDTLRASRAAHIHPPLAVMSARYSGESACT